MTKSLSKVSYELDQPTKVAAMANVLKAHVVKNKLYTEIQGKNYVHTDGWQFAGGLLGLIPLVEETSDRSSGSEIKWAATAVLIDSKTDKIVGRGYALCSSKENKKKGFDEYAILSMAQTRAIGKAFRNRIGWVMKMAGYESTPSEEMKETPREQKTESDVVVVPEEYTCVGLTKSGCGADLTKQEYEYSMKMFKKPLCREHQKELSESKKK